MPVAKLGSPPNSRPPRSTGLSPDRATSPTTELQTITTQPPSPVASQPAADAPEDAEINQPAEPTFEVEALDEVELDQDPVAAMPEDDAATGPAMDAVDPLLDALDTADPGLDAVDPGLDAVDPVLGSADLALDEADPALDEEELVGDLDAVVVVEDEEEEDDALPPPSNRVAPRMPGHMPGVPNRPIMHARMPAKAEIFHEGDHVVYPTHGVGKVERIATEEIAGHKLELIHITFEENRMTLRVPVSKARSAGLRKLASRKMFDEAMAILKGRARIKRTMWSRRAQEYEAKINSGDPLAIAEVVRDLHRNSGQPDQSFSERQIYEAAMDRLAAELAALDKTDKPTAVTKLGDFLKTI